MTLDLSSAVDHTLSKKKPTKSTPATSTVPEVAEATQAANEDQDISQEQNGTGHGGGEVQDGTDLIMSNATDDQPPREEPEDRIQILDLHSSNPIISYQGQIYSCEWTSTIGTDILLSASDPDFPHPVLKDEAGVSIIAATGIKLFGRPIELTPRSNASAGNEQTPPTNSAPTDSTAVAENAPAPETPVKITIPPNLTATKGREKQAKFLERLIAIKAAKAEKDEVTVHSQRAPKKPGLRSNVKPSEKRRAAEAQEAGSAAVGDGEDVGNDDMPVTPAVQRKTSTRGRASVGRPRGRRPGRRTQKGGLFRDYRPSPTDTPGADIRNNPSSTATPDSWDQLYPQFPSTNNDNDDEIRRSSAALKTPHPPQASPPRTVPLSTPHPHPHTHRPHSPPTPVQNLDPALFHPPLPPSQTPRSSSAANASADAATASAAGAPSLIVRLRIGNGRRRMIGERRSDGGVEGARNGIVGGGIGLGGGGSVGGDGGDGDDVVMEDV